MKTSNASLALLLALVTGLAMPLHALADDDPAAYFENDCIDCHHLKKKPIDDKHLTRDEWKKAIDKMLELEKLDPVPSPQFVSTLLDWLVKNHGPVDTAGAPAPAAAQAPKSQ
jgi:hypothetical protein